VLAASLDYYCYISLRFLPKWFEHMSKAVYSKIECVNNNDDFEHPSINAVLKFFSLTEGIELHHDSDIPARTGIGSSSAFTVGLINGISTLLEKILLPREMAETAIYIEQKLIKENVGVQDQIIASYGGFRKILLNRNGIESVESLSISNDYRNELEKNILFGFTGVTRFSEEHSSKLVTEIQNGKSFDLLKEISLLSNLALNEFENESEVREIGKLIDYGWKIKRTLSKDSIPNNFNELYEVAIRNGAFGGKMMGAGGGGAFYFIAPYNQHQKIKNSLPQIKVWIPVRFSSQGSSVLFNSN
jgi:D-glycero-alpha-D-manno-heptose-7-phosphate kinase